MSKGTYGSQKYVLLDTETGGLSETRNPIIELGARILTPDLRFADSSVFHAHIRPAEGLEIDSRALAVNNLRWADDPDSDSYKKALSEEEAWEKFVEWLMKNFEIATWIVPVGWNVRFDAAVLKALFQRVHPDSPPAAGQPPWPFHYHTIDLLGIVRFFDARMGRERESYRLQALAVDYYGTAAGFAMHTALGDSDMALRVAHVVEEEYIKHVLKDREG